MVKKMTGTFQAPFIYVISAAMFQVDLVEKIDKALENRAQCTLIHKMGAYFHGTVSDSWVRVSGGKLRGKVRFFSEEKGELEVDANDILDLREDSKATKKDNP